MEERRHRFLKSSQHRTKPKNRLQREKRENKDGKQTLTKTDRESEMNSVPSSSQQTTHSFPPTASAADVEPTARNLTCPAGQRPHSTEDPCSEKDAIMKHARQLLTMSKRKHFRQTSSASVKTAGTVPLKSTFSKRLSRGCAEQPARLLINDSTDQKTICSGQFTHKDVRRGQRIQEEEEGRADLLLNRNIALQSSSQTCRFNAVPPSSDVSTFSQILDKKKEGGKPSESPTVVKPLTFQEEQPSCDAMLHTSFEKIPPSKMSKDHPHSILPRVSSKQMPPPILRPDPIRCDVFSEVVSTRRLHSRIKDRHAHFQSDITFGKYPPSPTNSRLGTQLPKIKAIDGDPAASFDKPTFLPRHFMNKAAAKNFDGSSCDEKPFRSLLPAVISNKSGTMHTNDFYAKKNRNTNSKHLKAEATSKNGHRSINKTTRNENKHYSINNRPARVNGHAIDFNDNYGTFRKATGKEYGRHGNLNNHAADDEHPGEDPSTAINHPSTSNGVSQDGINSINAQTTSSESSQGSTNVASSHTSAEKKEESTADSQQPSTSMSDGGSTVEKPRPSLNVGFTIPETSLSDDKVDREEEPHLMKITEEVEHGADSSKNLIVVSPQRKMSSALRKKGRVRKASKVPDQRKADKPAVDPRRMSKSVPHRKFSAAVRHSKTSKGHELKRADTAHEGDVDTEASPPMEIRITDADQKETESPESESPKSPPISRKRTVSRASVSGGRGREEGSRGSSGKMTRKNIPKHHKARKRSRIHSRAAHLEPEAEEPVGHLQEAPVVHLSDTMVIDLPEAPVIHLPETPTYSIESIVEEQKEELDVTSHSWHSRDLSSGSKTLFTISSGHELVSTTEAEQGSAVAKESKSGSVTRLSATVNQGQQPPSAHRQSRWKTVQVGLLKGFKVSRKKRHSSKMLPDILLQGGPRSKDSHNLPTTSGRDLQFPRSSTQYNRKMIEAHSCSSLQKVVSGSNSDPSVSVSHSGNEMSHVIFSKLPTNLTPSKELEHKVRAWKKVMSSYVPKSAADRFNRESKQRQGNDSVGERDIHSYQIYTLAQQLVRKKQHSQSQKRWYKAGRVVLYACFIARNMAQRSREILMEFPTFMDIGDSAVALAKEASKKFIDNTSYKLLQAHSRDGFCMNPEEKDILSSDPASRTEAEINLVMHKLIDSFCDFTLHTQRALAKLGCYTRIREKRVILREGHVPHNFYFILSGQAVVSMLVQGKEGKFRETQRTMTKGEMFGEGAIVQRCGRGATVTARTEMQLLYISLDDYINIFMPERNLDGIPDYIKFLSRQSWMKNWPVELLGSNVQKCFMRYYRQRQVVVADSTCSENIYVVRNGVCQVLMLVDMVTTTWRDMNQLISEHLLTNDRFCGLYREERLRKLQVGQIKANDRPLSARDIRKATWQAALLPPRLECLTQALAASRKGIKSRYSYLNLLSETFSSVHQKDNAFASTTFAANGSHTPLNSSHSHLKVVSEEERQESQEEDSEPEFSKRQGLASRTRTQLLKAERFSDSHIKTSLPVSSKRSISSPRPDAKGSVSEQTTRSGKLIRVASDSSQNHSTVKSSSSTNVSSYPFPNINNNQGWDDEQPRESSVSLGQEAVQMISGGSSAGSSSSSMPMAPLVPSRRLTFKKKVRHRLGELTPTRQVTPRQSSWVRRRQYTIPQHCRPACRSVSAPLRPRKPPPVYVEIMTLSEGDVFGFDQLDIPLCVQPKTHRVSLVSCGADVIVMKKRFFLQHANVNALQAVHLLTSPYPSPEEVKHVWRMEQARDLYHELLKKECQLKR